MNDPQKTPPAATTSALGFETARSGDAAQQMDAVVNRRTWTFQRWLRAVGCSCGAVVIALLLLTMFATELTRAFISETVEAPITLPQGVDVRYSDRLVAFIGRGTSSGRATAVTLGSVILVPRRFDHLTLQEQRRILRHELVHVEQHDRYGRFYLPFYGVLYVVRGYTDHPFEREATHRRQEPRPSTTVDLDEPWRLSLYD